MEVFKRETEEILQQLRDGQISYTKCIAALDVAFAALIPRLADGQSRPVRGVFLTNRNLAIKKINQRRRLQKAAQLLAHRPATNAPGEQMEADRHAQRLVFALPEAAGPLSSR